MADFTAEVRRFMTERGLSLRGLARAAGYDPSYLSKILSGRKAASPYLARCLDEALGADCPIERAASQPADPPTGRDRRSAAPGEAYQGRSRRNSSATSGGSCPVTTRRTCSSARGT